jgi:hypothetical protein
MLTALLHEWRWRSRRNPRFSAAVHRLRTVWQQVMKITILGTRGEIPKSDRCHRKHSGVLIDDAILFDLGEHAFLRHRPQAIFITHLHPDHAVFVREPVHIAAPIYAPEPGRYQLRVIAKPQRLGPYRIRPIPTRHAILVKSCAYLVERNNGRVLYTGDIVGMDRKHRRIASLRKRAFSGKADSCVGIRKAANCTATWAFPISFGFSNRISIRSFSRTSAPGFSLMPENLGSPSSLLRRFTA